MNSILSLSFIIATRFFGLFILLPVLSLYAFEFKGANEITTGLLIGIYAIFQMIFQIPFGILSDKFGRKNIIAFGLFIFILGCVVCIFATDIYTLIIGRAIQGCGAIGAVASALIADFTTEETRSKSMAITGVMIGVSFALSMVLSPILSAKFGLDSLFIVSAVLTLFAIFLLYFVVKKEKKIKNLNQKFNLIENFKDKNLILMNITSFLQKMFMTMAFLIIPIILVNKFGFLKEELYKIYILSMIFGFLAMGFSGSFGDKKGFAKQILLSGIVIFIISYAIFAFADSLIVFCFGIVVFFLGFNLHEPIMQSVASKFAKSSKRGSVLGVFNSFGFFGSFIGGVVGGIMLKNFGLEILGIIMAICGILWFFLMLKLTNPSIFKNLYLDKNLYLNFEILQDINGIVDIYEQENFCVVKFDSNILNDEKIFEILKKT